MRAVKAPNKYDGLPRPWVFLAGSIEMGAAEDWQTRITEALKDEEGTILNPRRADWDSSWRQHPDNPQFREQVEWELQALEAADIIYMHFDPATKSPISLLELGLHAKYRRLIVYCPETFWRYGNVALVCEHHRVCSYTDELSAKIRLIQVVRARRTYEAY